MPKKEKKYPYSMIIERTVVDKLGLKLYDKVSAVVAELIANSYDADGENVTIKLPLAKALAVKKGKKIDEKGYVIEVIDDGHGMTPEEANSFYLRVGKDKRDDPKQGNLSRNKKRPVMGRKGIGKLSPFGVCRTIEIRSSGGKKSKNGYQVTNFELDYDKILGETSEEDPDYHPKPLADDGKFDEKCGTIVRLKNFLPRMVPDKETFLRQLTYRFLPLHDFKIFVKDTKKENPEPQFEVTPHDISIAEETRIVVDDRPVITKDGRKLKVFGWIGMAKESYKNVEFAGVRIYARGKIASITRDFGSPAGFTGEFVARSYLVGELHADWLDEEEDLIQTHRQDILWSTELGQAFSEWGQVILKEVARKGREPRREIVKNLFLKASKLQEVAKERFNDPELEIATMELGEKIGAFANEDELLDEEYVKGLREIILTVAPHKLLVDTFRKIEKMAVGGKIDLKELVKLFNTSRIAQLASYGQVVEEKIKAIDLLENLIRTNGTSERAFQEILEDAPWLIEPKWVPLTANQTLESFRGAFEAWYKKKYNEDILTSTMTNANKRPDFILLNLENHLVIIEIKPPKHVFGDEDFIRLERYNDSIEEFFKKQPDLAKLFPNGLKIILVSDSEKLSPIAEKAMAYLENKGTLKKETWECLLVNTKQAHESFLLARSGMKKQE